MVLSVQTRFLSEMPVLCLLCVTVLLLAGICQGAEKAINPKDATILTYDNTQTKDGYNFYVKTDDGFQREEEAEYKIVDGKEVLSIQGFYTYIGDDNVRYTVAYIADENGFRALGPHLVNSAGTKKGTPVGNRIDTKTIITLGGIAKQG